MTTSDANAVRAGSGAEPEARPRADLLGEVTAAPAGSLNPRLLDLTTPRVADWAVLVPVADTGGLMPHGATFATAIPPARFRPAAALLDIGGDVRGSTDDWLPPGYAGAGRPVLCEAVGQNAVEHLDGRAHDDIALLAVSCER